MTEREVCRGMAGYLFGLDSVESLRMYARKGVYSTKLPVARGAWGTPQEGTFADYVTMKAGDNVYFFIKRRIYGIGELLNVGDDSKFCNFPGGSSPRPVQYEDIRSELLWDEGEYSKDQRWLCVFKPAPHFFTTGVDMDDVLSSNPAAFKMLRAFWKLSFVKFDDEENQAFRDVLLKFNQDALAAPSPSNIFDDIHEDVHAEMAQKIGKADYGLDPGAVIGACADGDRIRHEMAIEAGLLAQLAQGDRATVGVFGRWDYLSHQVVASPFKPVDYMDKMDVFGYSYVMGFSPTKSKYLVAEIKKDSGGKDEIEQLLKYVDWVREEYCFGDYSMIEAFLVSYDFSQDVIEYKREVAVRRYTIGRRPAKSLEWTQLRLVKYAFDASHKRLGFEAVE